jgi:hypothetical protein
LRIGAGIAVIVFGVVGYFLTALAAARLGFPFRQLVYFPYVIEETAGAIHLTSLLRRAMLHQRCGNILIVIFLRYRRNGADGASRSVFEMMLMTSRLP